jgi:DNA replication protein DnaC
VGKTHLAIALGIAASNAGYRTLFTSAADMVHALQGAHLDGSVTYKLRTYLGPSVLVIDELGYLPLDQASANWIFQVVSRRYERGSIILTSNRGFADWGQVFADQWSLGRSSIDCSTMPRCSTSAVRAIGSVPTKPSRREVLSCDEPPAGPLHFS